MGHLEKAPGAMTRNQLEHLIRASGSIAGSDTIVVIGSQAILASFPEAPQELLVSVEADLAPGEGTLYTTLQALKGIVD